MKTQLQSPPKESPLNIFAHLVQMHFAVTLFLIGLIWIVQMVHYPLMKYVEPARFVAFEKEHCQRIGPIVAPAMLLEGTLSFLICYQAYSQQVDIWSLLASVSGLVLLGFIWFSTFAVQVPIHNRLSLGFQADQIDALVRTNWIRTIAWTLRGFIAAYFVWVHGTLTLGTWGIGMGSP